MIEEENSDEIIEMKDSETTSELESNINKYFVVELIVSLSGILCPIFLLATIVVQYCVFKNPAKSWNWNEIDKGIKKSCYTKCMILIFATAIGFLLWCVIGGILVFAYFVGLIVLFITWMCFIVHIALIAYLLETTAKKRYKENCQPDVV